MPGTRAPGQSGAIVKSRSLADILRNMSRAGQDELARRFRAEQAQQSATFNRANLAATVAARRLVRGPRRRKPQAPRASQQPADAADEEGALYVGSIKFNYLFKPSEEGSKIKHAYATFQYKRPYYPTDEQVKLAIDEELECLAKQSPFAWAREVDPPKRIVSIHRVDLTPADVQTVRMRDASAPLMPHLGNDAYNAAAGRDGLCVFNYFGWYRKACTRPPKACESDDMIGLGLLGKLGTPSNKTPKPLAAKLLRDGPVKAAIAALKRDGATLEHVHNMCGRLGVSCYAVDGSRNLVHAYHPPERDEHLGSVFVCVQGGHLYPVDNEPGSHSSHQSIAQRAAMLQPGALSAAGTGTAGCRRPKARGPRGPTARCRQGGGAPKAPFAGRVVYHEDVRDPAALMLELMAESLATEGRLTAPVVKLDKDGRIMYFTFGRGAAAVRHSLNNRHAEAAVVAAALGLECREGDSLAGVAAAHFAEHMKRVPKSELNGQADALYRTPGVKDRTHLGLTNPQEYGEERLRALVHAGLQVLSADGLTEAGRNQLVAVAVDKNKAYAHAMYEPLGEWCRFDYTDTVEPFDASVSIHALKRGHYLVETDDYTILHGRNVYNVAILQYADAHGVDFEITHQLLASHSQPRDVFRPMISALAAATHWSPAAKERGLGARDMDRAHKSTLATLTGLLGRDKQRQISAHHLTTDVADAWRYCQRVGAFEAGGPRLYLVDLLAGGAGQSLRPAEARLPQHLYMYGVEQATPLLDNHVPMYVDMLCFHNMYLHMAIQETPGECVLRKTDAFISVMPRWMVPARPPQPAARSVAAVPAEVCAASSLAAIASAHVRVADMGHWKRMTDPKDFKYFHELAVRDVEEFDLRLPKWTHHADVHDSAQFAGEGSPGIALLERAGGLMVKACGGAGKSYLGKQIRAHYGAGRVLCVALTNQAALNLGGMTIARLGCMDVAKEELSLRNTRTLMAGVRVVIVDEFSMVGCKELQFLVRLKRAFPDVLFVCMGDPMQCANPHRPAGDVFEHPDACELTCGALVELTRNYRTADAKLLALMGRQRAGAALPLRDVEAEFQRDPDWRSDVHIVPSTVTMCWVNEQMMARRKPAGAPLVRQAPCYEKSVDTYLYAGLPLMSTVNARDGSTLNSELFEVCAVDAAASAFTVRRASAREGAAPELVYKFGELHGRFNVAYARTVHKAQCVTLDAPFTVWDMHRMTDPRVQYTALSRATRADLVRFERTPRGLGTRLERAVRKLLQGYAGQDRRAGRRQEPVTDAMVQQALGVCEAQGWECAHCQVQLKVKETKNDPDVLTFDRDDDAAPHSFAANTMRAVCRHCNVAHRNRRLGQVAV